MGFFKKIFKSKLFKVAAPLALNFVAPGVGSALGSSLLGAGASAAASSALGGGLIGAGLGAAGGGGLKGALLGGASGGLGGYVSGSGGLTGALNNAGFGNAAYKLAEAGNSGGIFGSLAKGVGNLGSSSSNLFDGGNGGSGFLGAAANLYSGAQGAGAAKDMARAQASATQKAIDANQPYLSSGLAANSQLSGALGLNGEKSDDILELLRNSPGYQFKLGQGTDAINKTLAAKGGLFSGNAIKEAQAYGQGLADQTYNDYIAQLRGSSNSGQQAAGTIGGLYQDQGNIKANQINSSNNSINQALAGIVNGTYGQSSIPAGYKISVDAQGNPILVKA